MMRRGLALLVLSCLTSGGCFPDLGDCDEARARTLVFSGDAQGLPAYEGQALIDASCGNGSFCHSEYAQGEGRYGVATGFDFDMGLATDEAQTNVLARGQENVYAYRYGIYSLVQSGRMPPGAAGAHVMAASRTYSGLPAIDSREGRAILRNWLACGVPVVERNSPRPAGYPAVGAVVEVTQPVSSCGAGLASCNDGCLDTTIDPQNCGGCDHLCPTGSNCVDSVCTCSAGLEPCSSGCVELQSSYGNCGSCDMICGATEVCATGGCSTSACPLGTMNCSGSCVVLATSVSNCGACDAACPAGAGCVASTCVCSGGLALCDGACVDLTRDSLHCGACGTMCPAGATCTASACACSNGEMACGSTCTDVATDPANCGACGATCGPGEACTSGQCMAVSFADDVQPIFSSSCADSTCHTGARPAQGLPLTAGLAYAALVDVPSTQCSSRVRVIPNNADGSYLLDKLLGIDMCRGNQMPKTGTSLTNDELALIRAWIMAGAMNN